MLHVNQILSFSLICSIYAYLKAYHLGFIFLVYLILYRFHTTSVRVPYIILFDYPTNKQLNLNL